jgi:membrane-bound lytic murein transglycosylase B
VTIPAKYAVEFVAAGHAYGIPPEVLAAVGQVESGMGANRGPSSAGAVGFMQFEPNTAAELGIDPRNDRQAIWGAAKYLHQLGYSRDPFRALASYNAGPRNWAAGKGYATKVQQLAPGFRAQLAGGHSSSRPPAPTATDRLLGTGGGHNYATGSFAGQLAKIALEAFLVGGGTILAIVGARHAISPGGRTA